MKQIIKTYKFRLLLTRSQEKRIDQWIGSCRWLYNLAKETKENAYQTHKINISCYELQKQLTNLKLEATFLRDLPNESMQEALERLEKAYKIFFRGSGYPKWAKKNKYTSITFKRILQHKTSYIKLLKIGWIKYIPSQEVKGELRRVTIKKESNKYYICIVTKQEVSNLPYSCESQAKIGIDMGISYFLTTSDGEQINNPRFLEKSLRRLRIENRSLSRKIKGSNHWEKQKLVVSRLYAKIKNQRTDFLHKISTQMVLENHTITMEDLNIRGMIKNRCLSRHISDVGWSTFFEMLSYKTDWYGGTIEKVDPKYTSQTCNHCGEVDKMSRISQSKFVCTSCGAEENADINAAKNILGRALSTVR